jgi:hypothetical protein
MAAELEGDVLPNVGNNKVHEEAKKSENKPVDVKNKKMDEKQLEDFLMG